MPGLHIGLMSGTSMDGIDAVLVALDGAPALLHHTHQPFSPQLRGTLLGLNDPGNNELHRAALAANALSLGYATVVRTLLAQAAVTAAEVTAIGCHGQTVRHRPEAGYTIQLVNGALLAELSGIRVVCDFRSRDIAAGGEGAPLVPAFHRAVFAHPQRSRAVVNIGGIANITYLPAQGEVIGFDCGPGNVLMDSWIMAHQGAAYDAGGAWAAQGKALPELLERLLVHEFFARSPPKSTGRDMFNLQQLRDALAGHERPVDVQATLCQLTAATIARALDAHCVNAADIYLCGGGARNDVLRERLAALLPQRRVAVTDELGIAAESVEAAAFAWLAQRALAGEPGNLPHVTGARGPRILGAVYPP
ncbi:MAG: anmK [Proteobacteria bacterium]|nr:anmK [Pseudomonadota bacterium]RPJ47991.1 MAG: anhydro-N-acetylmuramic acid kinase [Betaproteobacteria bacterium]